VEGSTTTRNIKKTATRLKRSPGTNGIGTLQERSLHAALKAWYAQPGDAFEQKVGCYVIDLVREPLLIEFQTRGFSALRTKLGRLLEQYKVRLVYPIAVEKWIVRTAKNRKKILDRRRSPKRGAVTDLFKELVYIAELAMHPSFSLELLMIREEEIRHDDGKGSWRRKGVSIGDRRLVEVVGKQLLCGPAAYAMFLPVELPEPFTSRDWSQAHGTPLWLGQKATYCLRKMGVVAEAGKRGNARLYVRNNRFPCNEKPR
jgi:hypothetical protein